jgi:hypothetical protein
MNTFCEIQKLTHPEGVNEDHEALLVLLHVLLAQVRLQESPHPPPEKSTPHQLSGDTTQDDRSDTIPCRMTGVTLRGIVSPEILHPHQSSRHPVNVLFAQIRLQEPPHAPPEKPTPRQLCTPTSKVNTQSGWWVDSLEFSDY